MTAADLSVPEHPIERTYWIIGQLKLRGLSLRGLARQQKVHPQSLSYALRAPNLPGETIIAAALGIDPKTLFSDRYTTDGERLYREWKTSRPPRRRNAKGGRAA
jgi:lambda repressor-like predicted transcriptional regulator